MTPAQLSKARDLPQLSAMHQERTPNHVGCGGAKYKRWQERSSDEEAQPHYRKIVTTMGRTRKVTLGPSTRRRITRSQCGIIVQSAREAIVAASQIPP
jgi:hypothetical protein